MSVGHWREKYKQLSKRMPEVEIHTGASYADILEKVRSLCEGENTDLSLLSNVSSLLYWSLKGVNWVGFYLRDGDHLILGPFHGNPACIIIPMGKGVCGTAASMAKTVIVEDVDAFPGHIACDATSRSEIVVPLVEAGAVYAVLDVDSPVLSRFEAADRTFFEAVVSILMEALVRSNRLIAARGTE